MIDLSGMGDFEGDGIGAVALVAGLILLWCLGVGLFLAAWWAI